jgi:plasmid maintenance system antidote protein VapI
MFQRTRINEYLDQNKISIKDFSATLNFDSATLAKVLRYDYSITKNLEAKLEQYFSVQPPEIRNFVRPILLDNRR